MKIFTTGWNLMRIVRLTMGIVAIAFALAQHDALLGFAGGFLILMSLFNTGCCAGSCAIPTRNHQTKTLEKENEKKSYEEVV